MLRIIFSTAIIAALVAVEGHRTVAADPGTSTTPVPALGDIIPRSIRIIGVDGESQPRAFGLVIFDGRFAVLVDGPSRKIVEIASDEPAHPQPRTRRNK